MCWPIIVTPESRSMQKASKSGREKVGLAMSRSFFRCVVSALPSSKDLDTFYAFNTPRSQNRSTPKIPKSQKTTQPKLSQKLDERSIPFKRTFGNVLLGHSFTLLLVISTATDCPVSYFEDIAIAMVVLALRYKASHK